MLTALFFVLERCTARKVELVGRVAKPYLLLGSRVSRAILIYGAAAKVK